MAASPPLVQVADGNGAWRGKRDEKMKRLSTFTAALLLVSASLAACGPRAVKQPPDQVTVQLKWVHQAQAAGLYLAQEKGYYAEENLEVSFVEGGSEVDILAQIINGAADFCVAAPEGILIERAQGNLVVALATIFRRSPVVYASLASSGIQRPADLLGRTASVVGPIEVEVQFRAMMAKLGLDISQVKLVPHIYEFNAVTQGDVESVAVYSTGGLIRLRQLGYPLNVIWPGDYGVHMYADTLATTDQMVADHPDLVTRFVRASLRGWNEAVGDPDAAVEATMAYAKEADPEIQKEMMVASVPLIYTGDDQIGWMRDEVWRGMHDMLLEEGLLSAPVDLTQVYTLRFLQEIYGGKP